MTYNFYPGPSKLYPTIKEYAAEAFESGILERNHRSEPFMQLLQDCIFYFKKHLNIPENYRVFFTSSATECWEIYAQSFLGKLPVDFYHNGAFGKKWAVYTQRIIGKVDEIHFNPNEDIEIILPEDRDICIVANETSNGTHINLKNCINHSGNGLLALDVVSSLGGFDYDITQADVWISSTQKCLGLPSGMGIMIVSPKAFERAKELNELNHYNSVLFLEENFSKYQTPYTPNILAIYLLKRHMESIRNIKDVASDLWVRAEKIYSFFDSIDGMSVLTDNHKVRSPTVIAIKANNISALTSYLSSNNVIIGKGYGQWKSTTFRLANFPATKDSEFDFLIDLITNFTGK